MINKDELTYKIDAIIKYLKENGGYDYKVYNHACGKISDEPDSNMVEYAEDVEVMINTLLSLDSNTTAPSKDLDNIQKEFSSSNE